MTRSTCSLVLGLLALSACKDKDEPGDSPPTVADTGWFDTDEVDACEGVIAQTEPADGESDWYWRDDPSILVTVDDPTAYTARLVGPDGQDVATTPVWTGLELVLDPGEPLLPDADYTLEISDCDGTRSIAFHTDIYGTPLESDPSMLDGLTWELDLVKATWLEPAGLGALLTLYFTTPVLLGVNFADGSDIDLVGAPGMIDNDGILVQDLAQPTWAFPVVPFDQAPYVSATSANVVFSFSGVDVPVEDFFFEATFAPDGSSLGGVRLTGVADTRNLGTFVNQPEDFAAICDLAAGIGTVCIPCEDAMPYCLFMDVRDVEAAVVPGITLKEQD